MFGIPDAEFGEALMAVVELQAGITLEAGDVRAALKAHLADYKVPKHIEIRTGLPRETRERSSSAACAVPIGSRRDGRSEVMPLR